MTTITIKTDHDRIIGFRVQGHSGYAEEGSDIVCAAVSSTVTLVSAVVNDVLGLAASFKVNEEDTSVTFRLPGGLSDEDDFACQSLLTGLVVYFTQLHDEHPDNIEVLEED